MGPRRPECRRSSLCDPLVCGVFNRGGVGAVLLNVHHNGPSTVGRMLKMFGNRVIFLLPAIQRPVAFKTCCVVRIRFVWLVEESGVRQLEDRQWIILRSRHRVRLRFCTPQLGKVADAAMKSPLVLLRQKICVSRASTLDRNWPGERRKCPFRSPWRGIKQLETIRPQCVICKDSFVGRAWVCQRVLLILRVCLLRCYGARVVT